MMAIAIVLFLLGALVLQGIKKIPANPPHKGQGTRLGKRIPGKVYNEGWGFFPLYPYLIGFILVKVARVSFEVVSERTRTLDRAESRIPILLTFRPLPELLIEYLDSGGEEGVKKQLEGKILERIREWAMSPEEGPSDWIELNQSQIEAVSLLVKKIASNSLAHIPDYAQEVPTWIWLRYFAQPRPTKFLKSEEPWARDGWKKVREVLEDIEQEHGSWGIEELVKAVRERKGNVEDLRTGSGKIVLNDLGVRLERLNLGDIDVLGEVGKRAEGEAKEEQERQRDALELKFVRERIAELLLPPFNYSPAEARDIVQTERKKVVRTIDDKQISLSDRTAEVAATILKGRS